MGIDHLSGLLARMDFSTRGPMVRRRPGLSMPDHFIVAASLELSWPLKPSFPFVSNPSGEQNIHSLCSPYLRGGTKGHQTLRLTGRSSYLIMATARNRRHDVKFKSGAKEGILFENKRTITA